MKEDAEFHGNHESVARVACYTQGSFVSHARVGWCYVRRCVRRRGRACMRMRFELNERVWDWITGIQVVWRKIVRAGVGACMRWSVVRLTLTVQVVLLYQVFDADAIGIIAHFGAAAPDPLRTSPFAVQRVTRTPGYLVGDLPKGYGVARLPTTLPP